MTQIFSPELRALAVELDCARADCLAIMIAKDKEKDSESRAILVIKEGIAERRRFDARKVFDKALDAYLASCRAVA